MIDLKCTIDMRQLPGCAAEEILVERNGERGFWCTATRGRKQLELGPIFLDEFKSKLSQSWHPSYLAVVGGQENLEAFFVALEVFLQKRGVLK